MIALDNIFRCPSCKKTFIGEESFSHKCEFDVVEIPVSGYYEIDGKIIAWGLNGKVYRLAKPSAENLQGDEPKPDRRGLDSTIPPI